MEKPAATAKRARPKRRSANVTYDRLGWSLGLKAGNPEEVIRRVQGGLSIQSVEHLREHLDLSAEEAAVLMRTSTRTLARRQKEGRLDPDQSDRLYRIARLYERAVEVFESEEAAGRWFKQPQWGLGGSTPLDYARTDPGAQEVEALLDRIDYGVLA